MFNLGCAGPTPVSAPPKAPPARQYDVYPPYGDGFILEPALQVTHADGNTATDLLYIKHDTQSLDTNITLTRIDLEDPAYPFFVTLCLKCYRSEDIIEQWAEIRHEENSPVTLYRFASASPVFNAREYWLTQFYGDYKRQATLAQESPAPSTKVRDSKIGVRASRYRIPSFVLSLDGTAREIGRASCRERV